MEETPAVWRARPFCLKCGRCCRETEMILAPSDIARLEALGYRREDFAVYRGGFYRLRNVDGYCYFYDRATGKCRVYPYRPVGCSLYPIVYNVDTGEIEVDDECPLAGDTREEELRAAAAVFARLLRELGLQR